jgi:tyrosyl-tRNA synthetase
VKFELAHEITARFNGTAAAARAQEHFVARSQRREMPDEIPERTEIIAEPTIAVARLLKQAGLVESTSAAYRLMEQGGVRINGEKVENSKALVAAGASYLFQVGKRVFVKIKVETAGT